MKKKVLVLGGGLLQIPLIKNAKEKGFEVFLSDYYENPPGKRYCDKAKEISTFSVEDNYNYAKEEKIDHILTIGTDQPVFTAATVSERLGLPYPITEEQGRLVTNKEYMKAKMFENGIPTPKYNIYSTFEEVPLEKLSFPLVIKPVDSQGQRGVHLLRGVKEIRKCFEDAQRYGNTQKVILEEYYEGAEITVNTWVKGGKAYNLLITDRLHWDDSKALGLCTQQRFPCKAAENKEAEINREVQKLVDAFEITDGPLYIQIIAGKEGVKFVEFGFRIGGGFESTTIKLATGIDILNLYLTLITEGENNFIPSRVRAKASAGSAFFMFAKAGKIAKINIPEGLEYGTFFVKEGDQIGKMENATSRVGYFIIYKDSVKEYQQELNRFDSKLALYDQEGQDLLVHGLWKF